MSLEEFKDKLADAIGTPPETRNVLDAGGNHPFSCKCETCRQWWIAVGPQNDDQVQESGAEPDYGSFTKAEIEGEPSTEPPEVQIIHIVPGEIVLCDDCNEDLTSSPVSGGILFQSKAICPACAPKWLESAKRHKEEQFIRGRCPEGKSFADWVRQDLR